MQTENQHTKELFMKCKEFGVFSQKCKDDVFDLNLVESGIADSMSMTMLAALIEEDYDLEITLQQFVVELRTLNEISDYIQKNN